MVASLLAVPVRQASKSAKGHAGCQIEPFHAARSDVGFVNVAADDFLLGSAKGVRNRFVALTNTVPGTFVYLNPNVFCPRSGELAHHFNRVCYFSTRHSVTK